MDKEKFLIGQMKKYQHLAKTKYSIEEQLVELLQERFPNVESIYFDYDVFKITTKKHTIRYSKWGDKFPEPQMVCDEQPKIPDTIEEFKAMKDFIEDDRRQCNTAYLWLKFRYKVD